MKIFKSSVILLLLCISYVSQTVTAGPIMERIKERRTERTKSESSSSQSSQLEEIDSSKEQAALPSGVKVLRDVPYGDHSKQRMDIYLPAQATAGPVPVIFMVHGGAWRFGDKANSGVYQSKVARWVPKGFIYISTNYRLVPDADPVKQAEDVAKALSTAQAQASTWGGDASRFIIMGHSAGAHLVALLGANPQTALSVGAKPWLGTISLDSGALNLVRIMENKHPRLYDKPFGTDPAYWQTASPYHVLTPAATHVLATCSTQRKDNSCLQAREYVAKVATSTTKAQVLEENFSHGDMLGMLGKPGPYTDAVEQFMGSLDSVVMQMVKR